MEVLIITGGNINKRLIENIFKKEKFDKIIAADKGLEILDELKIEPNYIIGDFDSVNKNILKKYNKIPTTYLKPEKDFTDTHMALKLAIEKGFKKIKILGGTGTRLDHTIANIHILKEALEKNIDIEIIDNNNKIKLINKKTIVKKEKNYKYVSLIPLTTKVENVTLKGFKYVLNNATLEIGESIGVSNEQTEENAIIDIGKGILILIFSKD